MLRPKIRMKLLLFTCLGILTCALTGSAQDEPFRVFTNQQGQTLKAKLLSVNAGQVTIQREDGKEFTLPLMNLSTADQTYIQQQAATNTAPSTANPGAPTSTATSTNTAPGTTPPIGSGPANPNDKIAFEAVNEAAGQPLFADTALWTRSADEVATALTLRPESKTQSQSSFRSYPDESYRLFGARPFSVAMYAERGQPVGLSIIYANKGDLFSAAGSGQMHFDKDTPPEDAAKILKKAMETDGAAIRTAISAKLGPAKKDRFGEGKSGRMTMERWDWRGQSILLAEVEGEYTGLQIVSKTFADSGGKVERTTDAEIKARVLKQVETRPGGDVVINDIPMVDQGPKGYCVPATAERAMRHLGVSADMYILANAGESGYGGGTNVEGLMAGMMRHLRSKGRSYETFNGALNLKQISRFIDKGVPVIWALYSTDNFNEIANKRTKDRQGVSDWSAWKAKLLSEVGALSLFKDKDKGHVVLIVGYNKDTNEIAFSDSWGERYKERWVTVAEAEKVSQSQFWVVSF